MSAVSRHELRPHHAFGAVGAVLVAAAVALFLTAARGAEGPERLVRETTPPPQFEIADALGRPLASSVQRLDLVMSPNAMWQAHTPEVMARAIAAVSSGRVTEEDLLVCFLPDAADEGFVRVREPLLDSAQAARVERWARTGELDGREPDPPLDGLWLEPAGEGFELCWDPTIVLSLAMRERHGVSRYPQSWSRRLADRLARCLWGAPPSGRELDSELAAERRERIWSYLMPKRHHVVLRDFDAAFAPELYWTLVEEGVAPHQMRIERAHGRIAVAPDVQVLGTWGYLDRAEAAERVRARLSLDAGDELPAADVARFSRGMDEVLSERWPRSGLEIAGARLLAGLDLYEERPSRFVYRLDRPARRRSRSYYRTSVEASAPPRLVTTLDLDLQREVQRRVTAVLGEHRAALALAIVVDVATGDVLAVDGQSAYDVWGILPIGHQFTPGSTLKVAVMAAAIEEGLVRPEERIDVGTGPLPLLNPRTGRVSRTIDEAEGAPDGVISAAECLALSSNRGMTQIGQRIPDVRFRAYLDALGYGRPSRCELGGERAGRLPPLPWSLNHTHASLCFGHEIAVNLWQHATALTTIVRGGELLPLRLFRGLEHEDRAWELSLEEPRHVFSSETARTLRAMMELGAREGTGAPVASRTELPELIVGTKTGTAEKVPTEVCLHAELAHQEECESCDRTCRPGLVGQRPGHSRCYTSSLAIFGRRADSDRELFVLVVVDEPRGAVHYGSQVAGPTAVAILREALGLTRKGGEPIADLTAGFAPSPLTSRNPSARPWSEGEW